jgi:hypothetical protein
VAPWFLLAAFLQCQQIILPHTIRMGLKILVAGGADADTNPCARATIAGEEPVNAALNQIDNIRHCFLPPTRSTWVRAAHMRNPLMLAVTVRFVDAINSIVSHAATLSQENGLAEAPGR